MFGLYLLDSLRRRLDVVPVAASRAREAILGGIAFTAVMIYATVNNL